MRYVLDASVAVRWYLAEERDQSAEKLSFDLTAGLPEGWSAAPAR